MRGRQPMGQARLAYVTDTSTMRESQASSAYLYDCLPGCGGLDQKQYGVWVARCEGVGSRFSHGRRT
jgi:hypothetical protein